MAHRKKPRKTGEWGTTGDDIFKLKLAQLGAGVSGGRGEDRLVVTDRGRYAFTDRHAGKLDGIEILDVANHRSGKLAIEVTARLVKQSDGHELTIVSGRAGIDRLEASARLPGKVTLDGRGTVNLANGVANEVHIARHASVNVIGGTGRDTIHAARDGSRLDGRGGNDKLFASSGIDRIVFANGYGYDAVTGFNPYKDIIVLWGITAAGMDDLDARISVSGGNTLVNLGDGDILVLRGVAPSRLDQDNFIVNGRAIAARDAAPAVALAIPDASATEESHFTLTLDPATFTDADDPVLDLAASLAGGGALPDWLSFDADTATFSGTPDDGDTGTLDITVTATDGHGKSAADSFTLNVAAVNDAPVLAAAIADQNASEDAPFSFALPGGTFTDVDDQTLTLTAKGPGGAGLPGWLGFDAGTATFSGTPGNDDTGPLQITVTARDAAGLVASDSFTLTVAAVNDAPVLAVPIGDETVVLYEPFSITLAAGTFSDVDDAALALSARLADGSPLPDWLDFDATTGTFSGTPGRGELGALDIRVTARDAAGLTASDDFTLTLARPVIDIALGTSAAEINALIASAAPGSIVRLAAGDHVLDAGLLVARDDVWLRGAGEGETTLHFDLAPGEETHAIAVLGGKEAEVGTLAADAAAGERAITLSPGHGLQAGDAVHVWQPNTQGYLDDNGWSNVDWADAEDHPFREALALVTAVDGDTVTLSRALGYDMAAGDTIVARADLLSDVTLSDFTVTYDLGPANPNDFANTLPAYLGVGAVYVEGAVGAALAHISILDAPSHGFDLRSILDLTGEDLTVEGAHNKGKDGNGYGVQLYEAFDSTLTGLTLVDVRHAVLFSSWSAEVGNTVTVASTNRDINFHGSPDTGNFVRVESAVLSYDPSQNTGPENGFWPIVGPGGSMHANTDFYAANSVVFDVAYGFDDEDTIYADEDGALIAGRGSGDILIGGAGDDIIIGGLAKDLLTGNGGGDLFLFQLGDNYDTITDFDPGEGDRLVLSGAGTPASIASLQLTDDAAGLNIRYGAVSTIILEGWTVASFAAHLSEAVVLDGDGTAYGSLF
ncbi:MAG: putative Ig domain-containing protein [Hyphomicrobiaceae bacterium]